ncbi:MAG: hypothetical protein KF724_02990 [Phycisphaeraceae bacterium]|nr:hypothetical protein [Phycisphaeraceae bacterium]
MTSSQTRRGAASLPPRTAAIERLATLVPAWPDLPFAERGEGGLADAILLESVRRWRTLEWLSGVAMERDPASIEAPLRAALLAAGAQLLLMDEPDHAVVNDTVEWAKRRIRPGAGRLVNAVLRRLISWRRERQPSFEPPRDHAGALFLPRADGTSVRLEGPPRPEDPVAWMAIATSHAEGIARRWLERHGAEVAWRLALHSIAPPPRIVADPTGALAGHPSAAAHESAGFRVWQGSLGDLRRAMTATPSLRVQDPGSAAPLDRVRHLSPRRIVDACAGLGTKTRQLASMFPRAEIIAGDVDPERRRALEGTFPRGGQVTILDPEAILALREVDLLLLDVPCSNSGVFARRPEAKYRFDQRRLASLVARQREIVEHHAAVVGRAGTILYCTCSLEPEELDGGLDTVAANLGREAVREAHLPRGGPGFPPTMHADGGGSVLI